MAKALHPHLGSARRQSSWTLELQLLGRQMCCYQVCCGTPKTEWPLSSPAGCDELPSFHHAAGLKAHPMSILCSLPYGLQSWNTQSRRGRSSACASVTTFANHLHRDAGEAQLYVFQNQAPLQRAPDTIAKALTSFSWAEYGIAVQVCLKIPSMLRIAVAG